MKKKTLQLAIIAASLGMAVKSQAQLDIDISFNSSALSGSGVITEETSNGGNYIATQGTFTITSGADSGAEFYLDPVPAGYTDVTIHGVANTGGADLYGDNVLGQNYISGDGLIFTSTQLSGNMSGYTGDVLNLWGNGGNSYTMAYGGPDFEYGTPNEVNGTATINVVPEPTGTTTFAGLSALGVVGLVGLRRKFSMV
jgi:hypothetical protein